MRQSRRDIHRLIVLLQRHLPLSARAAAPLVASVRAAASNATFSSRCSVTQIYDAGDQLGLMCQLQFKDKGIEPSVFVASIMKLSFDRKSPVWRDIAAYQRTRREYAALSDAAAESVAAVDAPAPRGASPRRAAVGSTARG